jgi:L-asparaginase/Glu-tRNA(Gln) amidotransferase subunit D
MNCDPRNRLNPPPHIHWIATGGTIAGCSTSMPSEQHQAWAYQSAQLSAHDLLAHVPEVHRMAHWSLEQPYSIGSQNLTPSHMVQLRHRILCALDNPQIHAILVTHGTDTLEDMLFFLYLTLPAERLSKPVVFTASMLPSDHPQADGPNNLKSATEWALACIDIQNQNETIPQQALLGAVLHGAYTFAPWVKKQSTVGLEAFASPESIGLPIHRQDALKIPLPAHCPPLGHYAQFDPDHFLLSEVSVVYCTPNPAGLQQLKNLCLLADQGLCALPTAIVLAALGHGNIPDSYVPTLLQLLKSGVRLVRGSRITEGGVQEGGEFNTLDAFKSSGLFLEAGALSLPQLLVWQALQTKNPA